MTSSYITQLHSSPPSDVEFNIVVVCCSLLQFASFVTSEQEGRSDSAKLINKHQTDNGDHLQRSRHAANAVHDTFTGVLPSNGVTTHL